MKELINNKELVQSYNNKWDFRDDVLTNPQITDLPTWYDNATEAYVATYARKVIHRVGMNAALAAGAEYDMVMTCERMVVRLKEFGAKDDQVREFVLAHA